MSPRASVSPCSRPTGRNATCCYAALYRAKARGRNGFQFYAPSMSGEGVERLRLETLLRRSMDVLLAQPDVDVRHLVGKHISVSEMTGRMLQVLRTRGKFTLDSQVEGMSRLDQAVAFVAALELCKNGHVVLSQEELFGPIEVAERAGEAGATGDDAGVAANAGEASDRETEFQIA